MTAAQQPGGDFLSTPEQRGGLVFAAVVLAAAAVAICARSGPVELTPPPATTADATACARLHDALPGTLGGQTSRPTSPASSLTAAWGRPAITLRCGLTPQAHPVSLNEFQVPGVGGTAGLDWYEDAFDQTLWTTRARPLLAVAVPEGYSLGDVLSDVTDALRGQPIGS